MVESHTFENEKETEERQGHENVAWFNCAGLLQYLKSQLRNVEEIIDEVESADNPNQEYFLNKVIETAGEVKDTPSELLKISLQVLEKVEKEKMTLDDSNQKDLPTMPSLDPGMRSKHLTDSQKMYLIQIGPNQPTLQVYPSNSNMAKKVTNSQDLTHRGSKSTLTLNTVYLKTLPSVLFAPYLEMVQEWRKQKKLGVQKVSVHGINSRAVEK